MLLCYCYPQVVDLRLLRGDRVAVRNCLKAAKLLLHQELLEGGEVAG